MSETAGLSQHAECQIVFLKNSLNLRTMRTLTALALTLLFMGCKRSTDVQPDEIRYEPVALMAKDVENTQSTLGFSYQKIYNVTRNGYIGVTEAETSLDVSDIRPAVEAFIAANPEYKLYFRMEIRQHRADVILPNGSRKLRAGPVGGGDMGMVSGYAGLITGGTSMDAKQNPYDWNKLNSILSSELKKMLRFKATAKDPIKFMLSVYEFSRFTKDPTAWEDFDGSTAKSHAEGGSRVVYRGWNVELK